jgi:type IV pilus assembly protein PilA
MNRTQTKLIQALSNRRQRLRSGESGFTLVELMIVVVIVGILSAVALPNFLSQTDKAKATEATTKISALLKEAHAEYQFDGDVDNVTTAMAGSATTATDTGNFTYSYPGVTDTTIFNVLATGNSNDASLTNKLMYGCIDLSKGDPDISTRLLAAKSARDVKCK